MSINRRQFLKGFCITAAGLLVPDSIYKVATVIEQCTMRPIHSVRIMEEYDIVRNSIIIRYDLHDFKSGTQFYVLAEREPYTNIKEYIQKVHLPMEEMLKRFCLHNKISPLTIVAPAYPNNYKHSDFCMDLMKELRIRI